MSDDLNINPDEAIATSGRHHTAIHSFTGQVTTIADGFTVTGSELSLLDQELRRIPAEIKRWFADMVDSVNGGTDVGYHQARYASTSIADADGAGGTQVHG
ncbi:hypothetical protein [Nocardia jiangxiensis]|uniref:Excreted virulence factor EspC, type VII ESX diderm n=1 Tax=Nocardia jiangxiensis TaxID=282685 RepID=A0ABW6S0S0_9NOCA|nr:hypothetical protein [Nocardia jiangxiensis]